MIFFWLRKGLFTFENSEDRVIAVKLVKVNVLTCSI